MPLHRSTNQRIADRLHGGRVAGVETTRRSISTALAVDAAGAWTRQVAELAGGSDGPGIAVAPVRHQLLITEPAADVDPAQPIIRVVDAAVYLRPARGGLMLGGFEAAPLAIDPRAEPPEFDTDDVPLDRGVLDALAAAVADLVPAVQAAAAGQTVAEHRGGLFTMSPDGRFLAGPVPEVPGLWVASGCNGSGFSSSPAIGEALAAWICGGHPAVDLSSLSPARFGSLTGGALAERVLAAAPLDDRALVERGRWQYSHYYDPLTA